ncbi:MAG TPA: SDR family NAD(P)-dependent oxidoreductase [Bacteroidia bacterium]|jgi:short-subunit dehydrogenase|nr:SDR family NAD(P)-dependent oxidoreductase [Bacteroidia bacterium]
MNILITGASDGIGLALAKKLSANTNQITLVARSKEKLDKALGSLQGNGHKIIVADLGKREDVDALKAKIEIEKYDVFINNAGVGMYGRFTEMPLHEQVKMMNLNTTALTVLSYFYLSQAKKGDALVNVASTLGTTSYPGAAVYAATKAFVTSLSESLWWEYKNKGVYVLGFCPGATYTNFHEVSGGSKDSFPKFTMQTAEQVANELISALEKRKKPKVFSGAINRFMVTIQKLMSRKMVVSMMASFGPLKGQ